MCAYGAITLLQIQSMLQLAITTNYHHKELSQYCMRHLYKKVLLDHLNKKLLFLLLLSSIALVIR